MDVLEMTLLYVGIFLVLYVVVYHKRILLRIRTRKVEKTPELRVQAVLFSKTVDVRWQRRFSHSVGHLAFELPNGVRKDFTVDLPTYNVIGQGEEGILTYKEQGDVRVFVNFQKLR